MDDILNDTSKLLIMPHWEERGIPFYNSLVPRSVKYSIQDNTRSMSLCFRHKAGADYKSSLAIIFLHSESLFSFLFLFLIKTKWNKSALAFRAKG